MGLGTCSTWPGTWRSWEHGYWVQAVHVISKQQQPVCTKSLSAPSTETKTSVFFWEGLIFLGSGWHGRNMSLKVSIFKVTSVVSIECTRIWESDCQFLDDKKNRKILSRCMRTWCLIIRLWVQKHCQVYADLMSQPARSVVIFCRAAGVPHEHVGVGTQFFFLPCLDLKLVLQRWGSLQGTPRLRSTRRWTPCARWNTSFIPHMWGMQGGIPHLYLICEVCKVDWEFGYRHLGHILTNSKCSGSSLKRWRFCPDWVSGYAEVPGKGEAGWFQSNQGPGSLECPKSGLVGYRGTWLCDLLPLVLHQVADHWYPKESQAQARVDEYLEWQHLGTR